jgi:hypothetical protein
MRFKSGDVPPCNFPAAFDLTIFQDCERRKVKLQNAPEKFEDLGEELLYVGEKDLAVGDVIGDVFGYWKRKPPAGEASMCFKVDKHSDHPDLYLIPHPSCSMVYINDPAYGLPLEAGMEANCRFVTDETAELWYSKSVIVEVPVHSHLDLIC